MSIYCKEFEQIIETWAKIYNIPQPFDFKRDGATLYAYRYMQLTAKKKMMLDILELLNSKISIVPDGKNRLKIKSNL
jgi:hypothetical protein